MASVRKREWTYKGEAKTAWIVAYTDASGKRRIQTFDKKKDADRYRAKVETDVERRIHVPMSQSPTLATAIDEYLEHMERRSKAGRGVGLGYLKNIRMMCRVSIVPVLGNIKVVNLTFQDVEQFIRKMEDDGLADYTIKNRSSQLSTILKFCIVRGYTVLNPVEHVKRERGTRERAKIRIFSKDEMSAVFAALDHRPPHCHWGTEALMKLFVHLGACCALRMGEIAGLTRDMIDFEGRRILIRKSLTPFGEMKGPKSKAGIRDVPMPEHISGMLRTWIRSYYVENGRDLLFVGARGAPTFTRPFFHARWRDILTRAGLKIDPELGFHHFHALRHFAVSMMIEKGAPITTVAELAGHASFDITLQVYAHSLMKASDQDVLLDRMAAEMTAIPGVSDVASFSVRDKRATRLHNRMISKQV